MLTTTDSAQSAASLGSIKIRELDRSDAARWDAFVESCPDATFFHRSGWKAAIETAFGHKTFFLMAESGGVIQGVLPLGHIRSLVFGNALISAPFAVYGGPAARSDMARRALEDAAESLALWLDVDYLELRNRRPLPGTWLAKELYVTFRKEIHAVPERNLLAIPRRQRAMVRKGIEAGLKSEVDDDVERFFPLYSESVRALGTPVFSKRYFQILKEVFGGDCEILTVTTESGRAVSSVLSFYFRDEVLPYYGGGTREARQLKANDYMYWELMRRSCERGIKWFDYGRSKQGSGSYSFKKNWGFEPQPLAYQYRLVRAKEVPNVSPVNPKYSLMVNIWKHLPLSFTNIVGPLISRNLA